ncbi:unnamed protein product [Schistosoma margrebowiei]|uniref:Reverse transcriptase domain-containing protein n=1 Tax=Schistosoma margrebowiei TaxID=48269 RepID=A0AA84ZLK8_9TREM|nr:unnamed protein product [Schistosoma margrebowiei]
MDDILVMCDNNFDIAQSLDKLDSLTYEEEINNRSPFLDILSSRWEVGIIMRSVYRKPTWSDQYLNFQFLSVVARAKLRKCLSNSTQSICAADMFEDVKLLTDTVISNGYPLKFINKYNSQSTPNLFNSVAKESVNIPLLFGSESNSMILGRKLKSAIEDITLLS